MISINTEVDGIFYPPLPLKSLLFYEYYDTYGDKVDGILLEQYSKKIWIMQLFPLLQGINNKRTN